MGEKSRRSRFSAPLRLNLLPRACCAVARTREQIQAIRSHPGRNRPRRHELCAPVSRGGRHHFPAPGRCRAHRLPRCGTNIREPVSSPAPRERRSARPRQTKRPPSASPRQESFPTRSKLHLRSRQSRSVRTREPHLWRQRRSGDAAVCLVGDGEVDCAKPSLSAPAAMFKLINSLGVHLSKCTFKCTLKIEEGTHHGMGSRGQHLRYSNCGQGPGESGRGAGTFNGHRASSEPFAGY